MSNKLEVGLLARVLLNQSLLILKDKEIAKLLKQVGLAQAATDRMESCYIQMKKEVEQLQSELKCCRRENTVLLQKAVEADRKISKALSVCSDNRLCIGKYMIEDETLGLIGEVEKALQDSDFSVYTPLLLRGVNDKHFGG